MCLCVTTGVPSVWEVDSGREVWRASEPLLSLPDKEGVTLINQLTYSKVLDSVVMTTYDHSILFAKTSSMKIWKQVLYVCCALTNVLFLPGVSQLFHVLIFSTLCYSSFMM